jgi:large subunit ribosomal protein L28
MPFYRIIHEIRKRNSGKKQGVKVFFGNIRKIVCGISKFCYLCIRFFTFISNFKDMSRVCQLTGKSVMVGNNVSHSNRKTKRRFYPNLVTKKFFLPEEEAYITLKISTSALRTINKKGIAACIKEARQKGFLK